MTALLIFIISILYLLITVFELVGITILLIESIHREDEPMSQHYRDRGKVIIYFKNEE